MEREYFVGVDLGQSQDFTAIAVVERTELTGEWDPVAWAWRKEAVVRLRLLERTPLGTPYLAVVERLARVVRAVANAGPVSVAADATGVGRPVVEMIRAARMNCRLLPVLITGGEWERREGGFSRVPKRDLIVGLQAILQAGELRIAAGLPLADTLGREMRSVKMKMTGRGHETFAAWREGEHDDLVLAVALGCWACRSTWGRRMAGEAGWWVREEGRAGGG